MGTSSIPPPPIPPTVLESRIKKSLVPGIKTNKLTVRF